jgi:thiamine transporter ThiT
MNISSKIFLVMVCVLSFAAGSITASIYGLILPIVTISISNASQLHITSVKVNYVSLSRTLSIDAGVPISKKETQVKFLAEGDGTCVVSAEIIDGRIFQASCGVLGSIGYKAFEITDTNIRVIK